MFDIQSAEISIPDTKHTERRALLRGVKEPKLKYKNIPNKKIPSLL